MGAVQSWASSPAVRRSMQSNRPRDTLPEVALRSALHRHGYRFFKHRRVLAGLRCEPDIVFPARRVAVFVDGCFWHGCIEHRSLPKTNAEWWRAKLQRTRERDACNDAALAAAGWRVVRVWEHQVGHDAVGVVAAALADATVRWPGADVAQ